MTALRSLKTIDDLEDAGLVSPERREELEDVAARYAVAVTPTISAFGHSAAMRRRSPMWKWSKLMPAMRKVRGMIFSWHGRLAHVRGCAKFVTRVSNPWSRYSAKFDQYSDRKLHERSDQSLFGTC